MPISGGIEAGVVNNVQVVDPGTVKFVLNQPVSTFLSKLTGFRIIPSTYTKMYRTLPVSLIQKRLPVPARSSLTSTTKNMGHTVL